MGAKVIYFEKMTDVAHRFIEKYKGPSTKVTYWHNLSENEKKIALSEAEYLVAAVYPITRELLLKAPKVKLIQKTGAGLDNIDLPAARDLGIMVASTPGANAYSVAELTIGLILSIYRKINYLGQKTKQGDWLSFEHRPNMFEMKGKTHGIIGLGNVGKKVAVLSNAFQTNVLYYDIIKFSDEIERSLCVTYTPLDELIAKSDIVSLHIPLTNETRGLFDQHKLNLMKQSAILINVARGNIVDETALANALESGTLFGAAADAFVLEPAHKENPLFALDNFIATPHIGGGTRDALDIVLKISFANILKVESGQLPDHLTKE